MHLGEGGGRAGLRAWVYRGGVAVWQSMDGRAEPKDFLFLLYITAFIGQPCVQPLII